MSFFCILKLIKVSSIVVLVSHICSHHLTSYNFSNGHKFLKPKAVSIYYKNIIQIFKARGSIKHLLSQHSEMTIGVYYSRFFFQQFQRQLAMCLLSSFRSSKSIVYHYALCSLSQEPHCTDHVNKFPYSLAFHWIWPVGSSSR